MSVTNTIAADSPLPVFGAPASDTPSKEAITADKPKRKSPEDDYQLSDGRKIEGYSSEEEYLDKDQKGVAQVEIHESAEPKKLRGAHHSPLFWGYSDSEGESARSESSSSSSTSSSNPFYQKSNASVSSPVSPTQKLAHVEEIDPFYQKSNASVSSPVSPTQKLAHVEEIDDDVTESDDIRGTDDGVTITTGYQETAEVSVSETDESEKQADSKDVAKKASYDDPNFMKPKLRSSSPQTIDEAAAQVVANVSTEVLLEEHMNRVQRESNVSLADSDTSQHLVSDHLHQEVPAEKRVRFERPKTAKDFRRLPTNAEDEAEELQAVAEDDSTVLCLDDKVKASSSGSELDSENDSEKDSNEFGVQTKGDSEVHNSLKLDLPDQDSQGSTGTHNSFGQLSGEDDRVREADGHENTKESVEKETAVPGSDSNVQDLGTHHSATSDSDAHKSCPHRTTELNVPSTTTTTSSTAPIDTALETVTSTKTVTSTEETDKHSNAESESGHDSEACTKGIHHHPRPAHVEKRHHSSSESESGHDSEASTKGAHHRPKSAHVRKGHHSSSGSESGHDSEASTKKIHNRPKSAHVGKGHHSGSESESGHDSEASTKETQDRMKPAHGGKGHHSSSDSETAPKTDDTKYLDSDHGSRRSRSNSSSSSSSSDTHKSSSRNKSGSGSSSQTEDSSSEYTEETSKTDSSPQHHGSSSQYSSSIHQHPGSSPSQNSPAGSLLSLNEQAVSLALAGVYLDQKRVKEICQHMEKNDQLEEVTLRNVELGELEIQRLAFSLKQSAGGIKALNFVQNSLDAIGAGKIAEVLKAKPSVESLSLAGNPIGDEGMKVLVEGLLHIHSEEKQRQFIKKLELEERTSEIEAARDLTSERPREGEECEAPEELRELMGEMDQLEDKIKRIGLEDNEEHAEKEGQRDAEYKVAEKNMVSEFTEQLISEALQHAKLSEMDSSGNESIDDKMSNADKGKEGPVVQASTSSIAEGQFCHLRELDVQEVNITDMGVGDLAVLLAQNTHLKSLNMAGNKLVSIFGWRRFAKGLEMNTNLEQLSLDHCPVGDDGIEVLTAAIKDNASLRFLSLICCGLTEQGGRCLVDLLKRNTYLTDINLMPGNDISDHTLSEIRNYLALNQNMAGSQ